MPACTHPCCLCVCLQEAQQDTIASFERYMSEDMARDWAADKGRLFGALAPSASGTGATGALSFGALPKRDTAGECMAYIRTILGYMCSCAADSDRIIPSAVRADAIVALSFGAVPMRTQQLRALEFLHGCIQCIGAKHAAVHVCGFAAEVPSTVGVPLLLKKLFCHPQTPVHCPEEDLSSKVRPSSSIKTYGSTAIVLAAAAGALTSFPGSARVGSKEAAYIAATKKLNAAAARHERLNAVAEFGAVCAQTEDKGGSETSMSSCWALLADVVGAAESAGLRPADGVAYVDALVQVGGEAAMCDGTGWV